MRRFTLPERLEIIKKYYRNSRSIVAVQREFGRELGQRHPFNDQAIRRIVNKFEREFTLLDLKPPTRERNIRSEENIAVVAASIEHDPKMSVRQRSAVLGIPRESIRRIMRLDLGLHPYRTALTQEELKPDAQLRLHSESMYGLTLSERLEIIKKYYRNSGSIVTIQREFGREVDRQHFITEQTIRHIVNRFEREFTLLNQKSPTKEKFVKNEEKIYEDSK